MRPRALIVPMVNTAEALLLTITALMGTTAPTIESSPALQIPTWPPATVLRPRISVPHVPLPTVASLPTFGLTALQAFTVREAQSRVDLTVVAPTGKMEACASQASIV